jgi:nucleoside-diphosphate-sugar epimerase
VRVLVTGGAGFVGSNLARACLAAGERVRVLDDLSSGRRENLADVPGDLEWLEGSVADFDAVRRAVVDCEIVYHQAALPSVPRSVEDPLGTHAVNATGTLHVLEAARRAGVRRVVYAASSSAYGDTEALPKREDMPPQPLSPYALQKLVGEIYCRQYAVLYGLEAVSLRYFNVFGPRQSPDSPYAAVVPRFLRAALRGERPRIYGDGLQSRDFTFVADVVAANRAAAVAPASASGQVLNVARGQRVTLLELWAAVCAAVGCEPRQPCFEPARPGDVRHSEADVSRARELLGWQARTDLSEGLRLTSLFLAGRPA